MRFGTRGCEKSYKPLVFFLLVELSCIYSINKELKMSSRKRRKYDADFTRNAVNLCKDLTISVSEVAANLGIAVELLYKCHKQQSIQGEIAFPGNGIQALTEDQKRIKYLEKQLRDAEMGREILKKPYTSSARK